MAWSRRRKLFVLGAVGLLGALIVLVGVGAARFEALKPRTKHQRAVSSLEFSADGSRLVSVSRDEKRYLVWEVGNPIDRRYGARSGGVAWRAALAPSGDRLVVAREPDAPMNVWDSDQNPLVIIDLPTKQETRSQLSALSGFGYSSDGVLFGIMWEYAGSGSGGVGVCDSPSRQHWGFCPATTPRSLTWIPDSKTLVIGGDHELTVIPDGDAENTNVVGPEVKCPRDWKGVIRVSQDAEFTTVACSRDRITVFGGGPGHLTAFDMRAKSVRWCVKATARQVAEVQRGAVLLTIGEHRLETFDARSGARLASLPALTETCFAISRDERWIALGHEDGRVETVPLSGFLERLR